MNDISEASLLVRNSEIPTGVIDGELVALDLARGDCFGMDQVGTTIWNMATSPIRAGDIIDRLSEEYEVDRATCAGDVLPFLADLAGAGLVRVIDE